MNLMLHPFARLSRFERWFLGVVWLVIVAKCGVVWWAVPHYHMPIAPAIVIGPTLFFAALATVLGVTQHE
jgi:hypothetical protein